MLITIALLEKRHDDAAAIYQNNPDIRYGEVAEDLAKGVRKSHPEVSLQIWQSIADQLIAQVKPKAYQRAAVYLRQMRRLYGELGQFDHWTALLARLRSQHKAHANLWTYWPNWKKTRNWCHDRPASLRTCICFFRIRGCRPRCQQGL